MSKPDARATSDEEFRELYKAARDEYIEAAIKFGQLRGLKPDFVRLILETEKGVLPFDDADAIFRDYAERCGVPYGFPEIGEGLLTPDTAEELLREIDGREKP